MGGFGSGRPGRRPIAEHMLRLDVRQLHRKNCLRPGLFLSWEWFWGDKPTGCISIATSKDSIRLIYTSGKGDNRKKMDYVVGLDRTSCHYGGTRIWFLCPRCGQRVAVLYGGQRFLCRHCNDVAYSVENEDATSRLLRRSNKLREKIGVKAGTATPILCKPKGMHQVTFDRIRLRITELESVYWHHVARKFNIAV
ncbi:hypothetical protein DFW101_0918 [Solidesulfovibrio carbinoliphilus subsp. oakridgensis]|uniref:Uncharacterized protein n=1 Tax=Solidesulfovibrio carbinoliphilus subsp. oakridgensis TaxID=694327 RepID=G7Q5Z6_9BACT|nr:hypothetical protein DFW101_0918 [Solidesulfovibrio carbinoliphilus subsp. oakridgensis]